MELSAPIVERAGLAQKASKTSELLCMGEAIPGPGCCSTNTKGISWASQDELHMLEIATLCILKLF